MGDRYPSLPQGPGNLLVQVEVCPTARSEVPNHQDPYLPDSLWWQYVAHAYSQEMTSIISDATNPRAVWPQMANVPKARSPILPQSQNPEKPPQTCAPRNFDGRFGDHAGLTEPVTLNRSVDMSDCNILAGYYQDMTIQEERQQLTGRRPPEWGIDSLFTIGRNAQLCCPSNADRFSSDVCPTQVPLQRWKGLEEAQQDPDLGSAWNSENSIKVLRRAHYCTDCRKAYRRPQDLKRHIRDKHEWQRKCPFCCAMWSRPERIRAHLMKKHETRLTKDQQEEVRLLRGRHDTISFLEKYETRLPGPPETTHPINQPPANSISSWELAVSGALVESGSKH